MPAHNLKPKIQNENGCKLPEMFDNPLKFIYPINFRHERWKQLIEASKD
jgi:hypothetical protein